MKSLSAILFFLCALAGVSLLLTTGCDHDGSEKVYQIGELNSVIADGLAFQLNLVPYEGQSNGPIIMQGDTIFLLSEEEEEGIQATFKAGFSIALLDADQAAIDALQRITGHDLIVKHASESDPIRLVYMVRKEEGIFTDHVIINPLFLDFPDGDLALITAENIVINDLMLLPNPTKDEFESEGTGVNVANVTIHQQIISIPQPNNGRFTTTVKFYAFHECFTTGNTGGLMCAENPTFLDSYLLAAEADWTPGTQIQSSDKTKTKHNEKTVTEWSNNEQFCRGSGTDPNPHSAKTNTACRVLNYPRSYRMEMSAPKAKKGTLLQVRAAPPSTQGNTKQYSSGFSFELGGSINISGKGPDAGFQVGASWDNSVTTIVPPLEVKAGNLTKEGAFWEFVYQPEILPVLDKKRAGSTCHRLMGAPQLGQTSNGKFSDAVQTVQWLSCPEVRDDVPLILKISNPHGQFADNVATRSDINGDFYVVDGVNSNVRIHFRNGRVRRKFGSPGTGDGQFDMPSGIAVDSSDNIYVADTNNNRIQVFDDDGFFRFKFGSPGHGDRQFNQPWGIAVDRSANIYVADLENNRIQVFDNKGKFLFKIGSKGSGDGQFDRPFGIAVDSSANIYVADLRNARVQVFDKNGKFLFKFGSPGTGNGQFEGPVGIAVDSSDNIYVLDGANARVQVFGKNGKVLFKFGSFGSGDGQFINPQDIAVDNFGDIYVTDQNGLQVFGTPIGIDVEISFTAALADSSLRVWCNSDCSGFFIPGGGDCSEGDTITDVMCDCHVRTSTYSIGTSITYTIPYPSLKCKKPS